MSSGRGGGRSWRDEEEDNSNGSSSARKMVMAGAAATGVASLAWAISKLMSAPEETEPHIAAPSLRSDNFRTYSTAGGNHYSSSDESESSDDSDTPFRSLVLEGKSICRITLVRWERPPPGFYKLNFDGSVRHQNNLAGAGCVIRDYRGFPVIAAAYRLDDCENVFFAEAEALTKGLELAKSLNIEDLYIEGDSKEVISRVKGAIRYKNHSLSSKDYVIGVIKRELKQSFSYWKIEHVKRDANKVADALAKIASDVKSEIPETGKIWIKQDLTGRLPNCVSSCVEEDIDGTVSY